MRGEIANLGEACATLLRSVDDGGQRVDRSDWTIAEVGAHLVDVARRDVAIARGERMPYPDGDDTHAAMAAMNAHQMVDERDPAQLAALLIDENETLLAAIGDDPDRHLHWYDVEVPAASIAGVWLGELLIHGLDLARTLGRGWPIDRDQAVAVFEALVPIFPRVVNQDAAPKAAGTYHLRVRGHADYAFEVTPDGDLTIESRKPDRADLHVSVSPVAYLLVGYGRANEWAAVAKGQIRAWGRKPWLAPRFGSLFNPP